MDRFPFALCLLMWTVLLGYVVHTQEAISDSLQIEHASRGHRHIQDGHIHHSEEWHRIHGKGFNKILYPGDVANSGASLQVHTRGHFQGQNCTFGLCEHTENYPTDKINRILSASPNLKELLYVEEVPVMNINTRFGTVDETFCATTFRTIFPTTAMNVKNVEKTIVNVDDAKQGVVLETCVQEDKPCKYSEVFPDTLETSCKQKYSDRKLMVLGHDNSSFVWDSFRIPTCCVCYIKKT